MGQSEALRRAEDPYLIYLRQRYTVGYSSGEGADQQHTLAAMLEADRNAELGMQLQNDCHEEGIQTFGVNTCWHDLIRKSTLPHLVAPSSMCFVHCDHYVLIAQRQRR
jgi:hypothetical protein